MTSDPTTATPAAEVAGLPARVQAYVAVWITIGVVASVAAWVASSGSAMGDTTLFFGVAAAVVAAELTELRFRFSERLSGSFTLVEAAIVADILLLDAPRALLAAATGAVLANLLRRRELTKIGFNASQIVVSTAAALVTIHAFPDVGPLVAGQPILGAVAGMAVYGLVNFVSLAGLLRLLADRGIGETLRDQGWLMGATIVGDAPLGLLAAELALTRPELLLLLVGPTVAVFFAYRGTVRTNTLLARIRTEHDRLERVTGGTSDGILLLDRDGRIEVWNHALEAMTGIPAAEALGHTVGGVLNAARGGEAPTVEELLAAAVPAEPSRWVDATLTHRVEHTRRVVRESHTFLFDDRGRCTGDVVLFADVTREREVEALKSDFVARVSHELRTPLTPIKGFGDMLLRRGHEMSEEQRRAAYERIVERADSMTGLVEDLLLVTQLDEDPARLVHPVRCWVDEVVASVVARMDESFPGRSVHVSAAPDLGAAMADPERTRQVLVALVDNALRYSGEDAPIEITIESTGDDVAVHVRDHGPGIPSQHQEAIFERFHRLEDVLRMRTGGVGLGLFLARRLAQAMHGTVTVSSRPGDGATFTLWLPAAVPNAVEDTPPSSRIVRLPRR